MRSPTPAPRLAAFVLSALASAPIGQGRNAPASQAPVPAPQPAWLGPFHDCNANGIEDSVDIALGTSSDFDLDGVPDECQSHVEAPAGGSSAGVRERGNPRSGHES